MKKFLQNSTGQWIKIAVVLGTLIYAAGKITLAQEHIVKQIAMLQKDKVNKELYLWQIKTFEKQLDRIEGKIDAITASDRPGAAAPGD